MGGCSCRLLLTSRRDWHSRCRWLRAACGGLAPNPALAAASKTTIPYTRYTPSGHGGGSRWLASPCVGVGAGGPGVLLGAMLRRFLRVDLGLGGEVGEASSRASAGSQEDRQWCLHGFGQTGSICLGVLYPGNRLRGPLGLLPLLRRLQLRQLPQTVVQTMNRG